MKTTIAAITKKIGLGNIIMIKIYAVTRVQDGGGLLQMPCIYLGIELVRYTQEYMRPRVDIEKIYRKY